MLIFKNIRRAGCIAAIASAALVAACSASNVVTPKAAWTSATGNLLEDLSVHGLPAPQTAFTNVTMRFPATVSVAADQYRVKFSNTYGADSITLTKVVLAKTTGIDTVDAATNTVATFNGGAASVVIPKGGEVWSDPVNIKAAVSDKLMVSWYVQGAMASTSGAPLGEATTFAAGDQTAAASLTSPSTTRGTHLLTEIDAYNPAIVKVVVAIGDSITFGTGGGGTHYPAQLLARFNAAPQFAGTVAVVNQGMPGNRVLHDTVGPSAASRFERDVLGVSGVTHVILSEGVNDLYGDVDFGADQKINAAQLIAAFDTMIKKAKANKLKIYLGTVAPFKGIGDPYDAPEKEAERQKFNTWIRANKAVDGIFDFDAALRSSSDPTKLDPAYDSGDSIHPNAAGYAKMASVIDLGVF